MDPPVLIICTSTIDNEALYTVSSLYTQPSQRRSEHKQLQTFLLLESTLTQRKMIGASCPDNMHIY
jgi:hypothetical protein